MAFSITNTGKAKSILKKVNFDKAIVNGNSAKLSIKAEEALKEILKNGEYRLFEALDEAGRLLKESWLTRSTSHKKYDFSSIQAESSLGLQKFYKKIFNNIPSEVFKERDIKIDPKVEKEIQVLNKKLSKSIEKIRKIIIANNEIAEYVQGQLKIDTVTQETLGKLDALMPNNVAFIDKNKIKISERVEKQNLKKSLKSVGIGTIVGVATGLVTAGGMVGLGYLAESMAPIILGAAIIGPAALAAGLAVSVVVAAGFLIAALVVHCNKERFGTIALKRAVIKINDEFTNALKCLNKAAYLVRKCATKEKSESEPTPTDEQKNILKSFVEDQKKLWDPYTDAAKRGYIKSEEDEAKGTHKSGSRTVKDAKTSTIGKMKEGISKTWAAMSVN
ncbi:MAG: hypothetical protein Q4D57_02325 [Clostridia bacterium]|nr:hypothetical protein [Clostridia bacterium]